MRSGRQLRPHCRGRLLPTWTGLPMLQRQLATYQPHLPRPYDYRGSVHRLHEQHWRLHRLLPLSHGSLLNAKYLRRWPVPAGFWPVSGRHQKRPRRGILYCMHVRRRIRVISRRCHRLRWLRRSLRTVPGGLQLRRWRLAGIALHLLDGLRVDGLWQHVLFRHGRHMCIVPVDQRLHRWQRAASQCVSITSVYVRLALERTVSRNTL